MRWIKDFCLEILKKLKENIAAAISLSFLFVISYVFKKYLMKEYTFTLPLWVWIALCIVISSTTVIILKMIDYRHKPKVLMDKDDIFNKLHWWLGQQICFVKEQTDDNRVVTWHFNLIDKKLGLKSGSAKKFLPAMFDTKPKPFPITMLNKGEETIAIRYDL
jgi:hypothetical protein